MTARLASIIAVVVLGALAAGCSRTPQTSATAKAGASSSSVINPPAGLGLQAINLPDVSKMEPSVRRQMETQFSSLKAAAENRASTKNDLARLYGQTGELLMAASLLDVAEACFSDAQLLAPDDRRWPYFLGHIYKGKGPIEKSVASFERAQQLAPDDVTTMVWLGEAYLAAGNAESADKRFAKAMALQPGVAAAKFGAGRAAL